MTFLRLLRKWCYNTFLDDQMTQSCNHFFHLKLTILTKHLNLNLFRYIIKLYYFRYYIHITAIVMIAKEFYSKRIRKVYHTLIFNNNIRNIA